MFSLEPFLESRYVVLKIRGPVAVHFISTLATSERTSHALWFESIPTLPDFLLKLLFADHISSVSFCHLFSLPQLSAPEQCSLRPSQDVRIRLQYWRMPSKKGNCWEQAIALTTWSGWLR